MQKPDNNPRRNFLKKIPIAIVSISALSLFNIRKSNNYPEIKIDTLSKSEMDEIIKNDKFSGRIQMKPSPSPVAQKNING